VGVCEIVGAILTQLGFLSIDIYWSRSISIDF